MLTILFYILASWIGSGSISTILLMFLFFRGPEHMIKSYIASGDPTYMKSGLILLETYIKYGNVNFVLIYLISSCFLGPIILFNLVVDFFYYTFKKKT